MSNARLQTKVGLFVVLSLGLLAILILNFSKGISFLHPTYTIYLRTADVGGIKQQAGVLLGGLRVGSVTELSLAPDGKTVHLTLKIHNRYPLRQDARFAIEQSGFLGDQHVAIYPKSLTAPMLTDGAEVTCEEPFNLQEAARAATGFIQRIDQTAQKLNEAILRVDRLVLNETTLSNVNLSVANFRSLSDRTLAMADRLDRLIATNAPTVADSLTNLNRFSARMDEFGKNLNGTLEENREDLKVTLHQLRSTSDSLDKLTKDLNEGKGLAGAVFKDAAMRESLQQTLSNLSVLSSNLSHYGLLFKPRTPRKESPRSTESPRGATQRTP